MATTQENNIIYCEQTTSTIPDKFTVGGKSVTHSTSYGSTSNKSAGTTSIQCSH